MDLLEMFGACLGFLYVYLVIRRSMWCWPISFVSIGVFIYIFYQAKLYSDVGLQFFYIGVQAYGWYYWLKGKKKEQEVLVERMCYTSFALWMVAGGLFTFALGACMKNYTYASLPYLDACTTVFSIIAQWFTTRKLIENWVVWFFIDILAAGIYFYKGLYPTMLLYSIYVGMAAIGFLTWHKVLKRRTLQLQAC